MVTGHNLQVYLRFAKHWFWLDTHLHDIPVMEDIHPSDRYQARRHVRLHTWNDSKALNFTRFRVDQLIRLYDCFHIAILADDEEVIRIPTGKTNQRGRACTYCFHPEELFLFAMTKLATGSSNKALCCFIFGGNETRWSYGYPILYYQPCQYYSLSRGFPQIL